MGYWKNVDIEVTGFMEDFARIDYELSDEDDAIKMEFYFRLKKLCEEKLKGFNHGS